jgi:hypothetical protein
LLWTQVVCLSSQAFWLQVLYLEAWQSGQISHSSDGILLGYTPHGRSYKVFNLETNSVVESCDVTFDETAPYHHDVFKYANDKELEEIIFVDKEL